MKRGVVTLLLVFTFVFALSVVFTPFSCVEASRTSQDSKSYQNYIRGLLFDNLGEFELAKDAYLKSVKYDSGAWNVRYRLALDYIRLDDFKGAEREFKYILKLRPYEEKFRYLLGMVYSYRSKYKKAIKEYSRLLERPLLELDEASIRASLGHLYIMQDKLDKAQSEYTAILKNNPNSSNAHFYLGYIFSELSRFDEAIDEFVESIELDPGNSAALNSLSYLYAIKGEHLDEALILVGKALEFEPSNGAYLDTLGWVYFKKGDFENARRHVENASVLFRNAEIFEHLGDVYLELGLNDKAKKNWKIALEIEPKRKKVRDKLRQLKGRR